MPHRASSHPGSRRLPGGRASAVIVILLVVALLAAAGTSRAAPAPATTAGADVETRHAASGGIRVARSLTYQARRDLIARGYDVPRPDRVTLMGRGYCRAFTGLIEGCAYTTLNHVRLISFDSDLVAEARIARTTIRHSPRRKLLARAVRPSCRFRAVVLHELLHHVTDFGVAYRDAITGEPIYNEQVWPLARGERNHSAIDRVARVYASQDRRAGRCHGPVEEGRREASVAFGPRWHSWKAAERFLKSGYSVY